MAEDLPPVEPGHHPDESDSPKLSAPQGREVLAKFSPQQQLVRHQRRRRWWYALPVSDDWLVPLGVIAGITGALVILALFLPPIKLWNTIDSWWSNEETGRSQRLLNGGEPFISLNEENTSLFVDGLTLAAQPDALTAPFSARIVSVSQDDYLAGRVPASGWHCGLDLPAGHALAGQIYSLTQDGAPPTQINVKIAPRADVSISAGRVALFAWDAQGEAWRFLHTEITDTGTLATTLDYVPRCVATFRVPESARQAGTTLGLADLFDPEVTAAGTALMVGQAQPLPDGTLSVVLAPGFAPGQGYPVHPLIQNFDDPAVIDVATVTLLVEHPALRSEHARQIAAFVSAQDGYAGAAIDYRALPDSARASFSAFIRELADLLHSQDRTLTVVVPAPKSDEVTGSWFTAGYDWQTLGAVADVIVVRMPLDPRDYRDGGRADTLLRWAITQVSPHKLWLGLDARSVEAQNGKLFVPVTLSDALAYVGSVTSDTTGVAAPGDTLTVQLEGSNGIRSQFETRDSDHTPVVHYRDSDGSELRAMWITTPDTLRFRMRWAEHYNLAGVMVSNLMASGVFPGVTEALRAYQLNQPDTVHDFSLTLEWIARAGDTVLSIETGQPDTPLSFVVPENLPQGTNELTLEAQLNGASLGSVTIPVTGLAVAAVAETPEPTAEPTAAPTSEPTSEPTAEPTAEPTTEPTASPTLEATPEPTAEPEVAIEPTTGPDIEALPGAPPDTSPQTTTEPTPDTAASVDTPAPTAISQAITPTPTPEAAASAPDPSALDALAVPTIDPALLAGTGLDSVIGDFAAGATLGKADRTMLKVGQMGLGWVRLEVLFSPGAAALSWGEPVTIAQANGFKVLLSVRGNAEELAAAPDWAAYANEYAQFAAMLAAFGTEAIEIWPGANTQAYWPAGTIDPARYAKILGLAYHAIKSTRPATLVITGAPEPLERPDTDQSAEAWDDNAFLQGLAQAGGAQYADCVGAAYLGSTVGPTTASGDPRGDAPIYYLDAMTARTVQAMGEALPVCYTRLGYPAPVPFAYLPPELAWIQGIAPDVAGQQLAWAIAVVRDDPRVRMAIIWLAEVPSLDSLPERSAYSVLRPDDTCPACDPVAALFED